MNVVAKPRKKRRLSEDRLRWARQRAREHALKHFAEAFRWLQLAGEGVIPAQVGRGMVEQALGDATHAGKHGLGR